ncbi:aminoacyl-tRNA ligase [Artemisia annua]|uniref:valine--tRNA ligase n=1 Tax=Artemisia annua TaxID=35608 RepID=A0A2U1N6C2_ARTAN|nr:aminoacyl-tRNA ligase [Artemisia annua]
MTFGRHVPIIADKYKLNYEQRWYNERGFFLAGKLGLPILNVMNEDGTLNEVARLHSGLDRFEARKELRAELEETGLAVKKEAHTSRVPRSQRGIGTMFTYGQNVCC